MELCGLSASDLTDKYPDYYETLWTRRLVDVHQELGSNTMTVVGTTVLVTFFGALLKLSLSRRPPELRRWNKIFHLFVTTVNVLPLFNFFNFVFLAQRVVRVKFKYGGPL